MREKTSPLGYRWTYLRFAREPRDGETHETATGPWRPAAGAFEGWPKAANEITVLDPCMGSGHFLVFALPILLAFRRAEEGLDERAAVKAVLADNLFGLEIDPRCTQIAAFALALASWKRLGGPEPLPRLNLACSGLAIGLGKAEFLKLAERIADASGWVGEPNLLATERTPLGERAAARLAERLGNTGSEVSIDWRLTPVPSVTATAKALVTPVGDSIGGKGKVNEFLPLEKSSGKPATLDALRKAMLARGIPRAAVDSSTAPSPSGRRRSWSCCSSSGRD